MYFGMVALGTSFLSDDLLHLCCSIQCWIKLGTNIGLAVCPTLFFPRDSSELKRVKQNCNVGDLLFQVLLWSCAAGHCSVGGRLVRNWLLLFRSLLQMIWSEFQLITSLLLSVLLKWYWSNYPFPGTIWILLFHSKCSVSRNVYVWRPLSFAVMIMYENSSREKVVR